MWQYIIKYLYKKIYTNNIYKLNPSFKQKFKLNTYACLIINVGCTHQFIDKVLIDGPPSNILIFN